MGSRPGASAVDLATLAPGMSGPHDPERLARELAGLARLELRDHEAARFGEQLAAILGYIDKLREVDVEGVPEHATVEQEARRASSAGARSPTSEEASGLAPDEVSVEIGEGVEQALAGVPVRRGRLIAVPKFKDD